MRHILGEDLKIGSVLTWGPGWYFQKTFFEGKDNKLSTRRQSDALRRRGLRLPVQPHRSHRAAGSEGAGFSRAPSASKTGRAGACPIFSWAQVAGRRHRLRAFGLGPRTERSEGCPPDEMPPFDGIGANEYIVGVTHDLVDFISTVDTPYAVGTEHLVSHAECRLSHAHQRRDRFPLHLRRQGGTRAAATCVRSRRSIIATGPRAFARPQLRVGRQEPPYRLQGERRADGRRCKRARICQPRVR